MPFSNQRYRLGTEIGGNQHSCSYTAYDVINGTKVFIKQFDEYSSARFYRELKAYFHTDSERILPLYDFFIEADGQSCIVLKNFPLGDLRNYVLAHGDLEERHVLACTVDILQALSDLHSQGYVHGDIKPDNIIIEKGPENRDEPVFYLSDLGDVNSIKNVAINKQLPLGSPLYQPPEMTSSLYSEASDLYSLGLTIYHLLSHQMSFDPSAIEQVKRIDLRQIDSALCRDIISALTVKNSFDRISNAAFLRQWIEQKLSDKQNIELRDSGKLRDIRDARSIELSPELHKMDWRELDSAQFKTCDKQQYLITKHQNHSEILRLDNLRVCETTLARECFDYSGSNDKTLCAFGLNRGIDLLEFDAKQLTHSYQKLVGDRIEFLVFNDDWMIWYVKGCWYCKNRNDRSLHSLTITGPYFGIPTAAVQANGQYAISAGAYNDKVSILANGELLKTYSLTGTVEYIYSALSGFFVIEKSIGELTSYRCWFCDANSEPRKIPVPVRVQKVFYDGQQLFLVGDKNHIFCVSKNALVTDLGTQNPDLDIFAITATSPTSLQQLSLVVGDQQGHVGLLTTETAAELCAIQ